MSKLRDFAEFVGEPLRLPIMGKTYEVPPVGAQEGVYMSLLLEKITEVVKSKDDDALARVDLEDFTDEGEEDLYRRALGTAYDEMYKDNVPFTSLKLAGMTAFIDFTQGRAAAEAVWNSVGGDDQGEAVAVPENRAARRAAKKATPRKTPSAKTGAAATTTKRPASGSGTRSRKSSSPPKAG